VRMGKAFTSLLKEAKIITPYANQGRRDPVSLPPAFKNMHLSVDSNSIGLTVGTVVLGVFVSASTLGLAFTIIAALSTIIYNAIKIINELKKNKNIGKPTHKN